MLVVVNQPHIEISLNGEGAKEALDWLSQKFKIHVIDSNNESESSINIENTDFWKEMNKNRIGNLIAGYRLKAELTQKQLSAAIGIKQNMISEYENGKRKLSKKMINRLASVLGINTEQII